MNVKKIVYTAVGCLGLGLGAVGAVVPLLPAFPFCFSSDMFGKVLKSSTTGSSIQDYIKTIWKATYKEEA